MRDEWSDRNEPSLTDAQQRQLATELAERLRSGDTQALAELFTLYQDRLLRLIDFRLDRNLHSRVDPTDVLQDAYIDALERVSQFADGDFSIAFWLRLIVLQRVQLVVRYHLLTVKRDARKEVFLGQQSKSHSPDGIAELLVDSITSPSSAVARAESVALAEQMMETMSPTDREVLILRHFEQLPNDEVAEILAISVKAASIRYARALGRLKTLIEAIENKEHTGDTDPASQS